MYIRYSVFPVIDTGFRYLQAACLNVNGNTLPDVLRKAILLAKNAEILNFRGLKTIVGSCLSRYPGTTCM